MLRLEKMEDFLFLDVLNLVIDRYIIESLKSPLESVPARETFYRDDHDKAYSRATEREQVNPLATSNSLIVKKTRHSRGW